MNKVESALSRTTDTKALVIGTDTLPQVAEMFRKLFPDKRALVVADANTWRVAGDDVHKILAGAGVAQDEPYVFTDPKLYAEWAYVGELDTVLAETDAVPVAVGSGVINDLTKLCSSHNGRRYMVVGTAASMDGYTAYGASITKDGNKQTFDCPAPLGMVLDPNIAAAAPAKLSASGYADLIAKIVAAENYQAAYFNVRQVAYALNDMAWHSIDKPFEGDVELFERTAMAPSQILPVVDGAAMSPAFSHIFAGGYAAGYYGYKWAEVLAADAFSLFKEKGIFNPEVAEAFRREILSKGGHEHPMTLYVNFRGHKPETKALIEKMGLEKSSEK